MVRRLAVALASAATIVGCGGGGGGGGEESAVDTLWNESGSELCATYETVTDSGITDGEAAGMVVRLAGDEADLDDEEQAELRQLLATC